MYTQKTLDIFRNPSNAGGLQGADGVAKKIDKTFGDVFKFYLKIDNNAVKQARFKTMGCVVSIAASSVITELVAEKTLDEVKELDESDVLEVLGEVPHERFCLLTTAIDTLKEAVQEYYKKLEKEKQ